MFSARMIAVLPLVLYVGVALLLASCTVRADPDPVLHETPVPGGPGLFSGPDGVVSVGM